MLLLTFLFWAIFSPLIAKTLGMTTTIAFREALLRPFHVILGGADLVSLAYAAMF